MSITVSTQDRREWYLGGRTNKWDGDFGLHVVGGESVVRL